MAASTNETTNFAGQVQGSLTSAGEVHSLNLDFTENAGQSTGSVEGVTQDLSNTDLTSNIANFTGQLKGTITTLGNVHTLNCNIDFGDLSQMGIYNFSLDLSKYLEQQTVEKDYYAVATLLGNGPVLDTNPVMQANTSVLAFDIKTFGGANTTAKINLEMTFATKEQGEGGGTTDPDEPTWIPSADDINPTILPNTKVCLKVSDEVEEAKNFKQGVKSLNQLFDKTIHIQNGKQYEIDKKNNPNYGPSNYYRVELVKNDSNNWRFMPWWVTQFKNMAVTSKDGAYYSIDLPYINLVETKRTNNTYDITEIIGDCTWRFKQLYDSSNNPAGMRLFTSFVYKIWEDTDGITTNLDMVQGAGGSYNLMVDCYIDESYFTWKV